MFAPRSARRQPPGKDAHSRGPDLQLAVQRVRHIPNLHPLGHVVSMRACSSHFKVRIAGSGQILIQPLQDLTDHADARRNVAGVLKDHVTLVLRRRAEQGEERPLRRLDREIKSFRPCSSSAGIRMRGRKLTGSTSGRGEKAGLRGIESTAEKYSRLQPRFDGDRRNRLSAPMLKP